MFIRAKREGGAHFRVRGHRDSGELFSALKMSGKGVTVWNRPYGSALSVCLDKQVDFKVRKISNADEHFSALKTGVCLKLMNAEVRRRACGKERNNSDRPETTHKCDFCSRDCF